MNNVNINGESITSINDFMVSPFSILIIPEKTLKQLAILRSIIMAGKTPTQNITL